MNKQELREAFEKAGYLYSSSDMDAVLHIEEVRTGVYATLWENWEETYEGIDEYGDEENFPTVTLDYVFVENGAAEHGGCGQTFKTVEEAKAAIK